MVNTQGARHNRHGYVRTRMHRLAQQRPCRTWHRLRHSELTLQSCPRWRWCNIVDHPFWSLLRQTWTSLRPPFNRHVNATRFGRSLVSQNTTIPPPIPAMRGRHCRVVARLQSAGTTQPSSLTRTVPKPIARPKCTQPVRTANRGSGSIRSRWQKT